MDKRLSIEEKAKAYDEAIKRVENIKTGKCETTFMFTAGLLEHIFPELAESKDEKIRKALIKLVKKAGEGYENVIDGVSIENAISWLEEQGKHANFRNKIQIGDKVTRNEDGVLVNLSQLNRVAKKDEKQGEQKPADKVEPKFKVGDIIRLKGTVAEYTIKKVTDTTYYTDGWSCGIERCEEDYELVEHKPAEWSEEDERIKNNLLSELTNLSVRKLIEKETEKKYASWLKSLRPQSYWRPSDKQMETLAYYMHALVCNEHKEILFGLYADLKKLKA